MNFDDYQKLAVMTAPPKDGITLTPEARDLLHCSMGLCTEAGEFTDNLKKVFFYGAEGDIPNLKEELGDCLWYIGMICERLGWSMEELAETNIEKLQVRFPDMFTQEDALNRDLETERTILEKGENKDEKESSEKSE